MFYKISIHAPRVGCDYDIFNLSTKLKISIHAPRVGCDLMLFVFRIQYKGISIHAPRVGCDLSF